MIYTELPMPITALSAFMQQSDFRKRLRIDVHCFLFVGLVCVFSARWRAGRGRRRGRFCASTSATRKWTPASATPTIVLPRSRTAPCPSARPAPASPDLSRPHPTATPGTTFPGANPTSGGLDPGARWGIPHPAEQHQRGPTCQILSLSPCDPTQKRATRLRFFPMNKFETRYSSTCEFIQRHLLNRWNEPLNTHQLDKNCSKKWEI